MLCRFWQRDHLVGSFHRSISLGSYSGLKSQDVEKNLFLLFLEKNNPLRENFQNSVPTGFTTSLIHVLCANFVKFGWWEVGEIARCLPDQKKTKFRLAVSLSLLRGSRPNLPGPVADNVLRVPQILSKSVHFRRRFSRARKHSWSARQSESSTRRSYSFSPSNNKHFSELAAHHGGKTA